MTSQRLKSASSSDSAGGRESAVPEGVDPVAAIATIADERQHDERGEEGTERVTAHETSADPFGYAAAGAGADAVEALLSQ